MEIEVAGVKYALYNGEVLSIELKLRYTESAVSQAVVHLKVRKKIVSGSYESCTLILEFDSILEANVLEKFVGGASYSSIALDRRNDGSYYFAIENIGDIPNADYEYDNLKLIASSLNIREEHSETTAF